MSEKPFNQELEDEISLKDIIDFLVDSWKGILATGLLGFLTAGAYITVTPNQYEATAQIEMAKLNSTSNNNNNNNSNPLGFDIESPNLLIARMKSPSSYNNATVSACGYEGKQQPLEKIAKMVKLSVSKGTQMVELKVTGLSQEQAVKCAQSVFEVIKESQKLLVNPILEEAQSKLSNYVSRLQEAQTFVAKAYKSDLSMSAAYLSTRDELKYTADEIIRLKVFISSAESRQTKLVSPIYSSDNKVSPKRAIALLSGLIGGLILGLVLMMGLRSYRNYRKSSRTA